MVGFYRFMEGGAAELVQIRQPCRLQWLQINGMEGFRGPWGKIKKKEEFGFLEEFGLYFNSLDILKVGAKWKWRNSWFTRYG